MITTTNVTEFKHEVTSRLAINYPNKKRILEIPCGDGYRMRIGRQRGHKVYGYTTEDQSTAWKIHGMDPYITLGTLYTQLPYPDDSFDMVMFQGSSYLYRHQFRRLLHEIYRIGSEDFFFRFPPSLKVYPEYLEDIGFFIQTYHPSTVQGTYIIEAYKA